MKLANRITIARMFLIPLFVAALQHYPEGAVRHLPLLGFLNDYGTYVGCFLFSLATATDKLDGYVARKYNQITNLGSLLDPLADKLLIAAAFLMLVEAYHVSAWVAVVIIGRELAVTYIRLMAMARGVVLAADKFGKWKMVLQVAAVILVLLQLHQFNMNIQLAEVIVLYGAVALTLYSGYNYFKSNLRILL